MSIGIVEVDPFDDAAFDDWHTTYAAAEQHERGEWASDWLLEESRAEKQARLDHRTVHVFSLVEGGRTVAVSEMEYSHDDNRETAWAKVYTHPDHRRLGHGSALLSHLEAFARAHGRNRLLTEVAFPYEFGVDGAGHAYADFLTHRGFTFGIGDVQRVVDLPVPRDLLVRLEAEAAPHHTAYEFSSFSGRVPQDHVEDYAGLAASLVTEAPTGDLVLEPGTADVASFRAEEQKIERQGRTRHGTVAFASDGRLAGYTDLVTSEHDPGRGYQWGTLVWNAHRGHRLGLALKVRNLAHLQETRPDIQVVRTWNAEVNAHMVGVNEAMGFRSVERLGEFQKHLGAT